MNRRHMIINLLSLLLVAVPLKAMGADYGQMKGQFKNYDSPAYYKSNLVAEEFAEEKTAITPGELALKEEELAKLKARWDSLIEKAAADKSFFDFESGQAKQIRKIARTEQIKEVLQKELSLEILIAAAFERNPGLQSAKKDWSATLERYSQATSLDNIMQQYSAFIKELNTRIGSRRQKQTLSQQFPFPGTLSLKGDIVTKEVNIARENYRIVLRDLITQLKLAYYELVYLGEAVRISDENLKLLKHLESTAFVKYKTGQAGYSDVIKVQVKISKLDNDIITLKEERKTVVAKLNQLLNLPSQFALGLPQPIALRDTGLSLDKLSQLGLEKQQEIKRLKLEIERTNLAIELAEKKFYPDFTLGFSYFEDKAGNLVGVAKQKETFSLKPAAKTQFWFGKNEAYIREARLKYQALQDQLTSLQDKLRYAVKEHYFHLDTAKRNVVLYRDSLLRLAQNALQAAETEYLAGKIDFLNVLDAQAVWLDYSLLYHRSLRDQNQSMAKLEQVIGVGALAP